VTRPWNGIIWIGIIGVAQFADFALYKTAHTKWGCDCTGLLSFRASWMPCQLSRSRQQQVVP